MRSLRFLSLFLLPAALVAVGCNEQNSPTAPKAESVFPDFDAPELTENLNFRNGPDVILSASGATLNPTPLVGSSAAEGGWRFSIFTAKERADGTVSGHLYYKQRAEFPANVEQWGEVTCTNTIGNAVLIAATGTKREADADPAPFPGLPPAVFPGNDGMLFAVQDNGSGRHGSPDQFTAVIHTTIGVAAAICANPSAFGFTPELAEQFFNDVKYGFIRIRQ